MDPAATALWSTQRPGAPPFDTACVAPWVSLEFDPSGLVYACCTSNLYPLGRVGEQPLRDLWGGARSTVLRDALRSWDLSVACQPCRWHLEHGRPDPIAAVYDRLPLSSPDPPWPHMMLFALSNRCNLGCVMCSPELSSTIRTGLGLPPLDSPYDDRFFHELGEFLPHLRLAKFLGGEPFLAAEHHRVWSMLEVLDRRPRLSVTTNGTVWTDRVEQLLERFEVDVSVSVDAATPETYAAIRRGGDLADVRRNVARFAERAAARATSLHVSFCLMPSNAHELAEFLRWAEPYSLSTPVDVSWVSNEGMTLAELDLDALESVRADWDRAEDRIGHRLVHNAEVWRRQRAELASLIAQRRAGAPAVAPRAIEVPDGFFDLAASLLDEPRHPTDGVDALGARTAAWGNRSGMAELHCGPDGVVTAVPGSHDRLRLDDRCVGRPIAELGHWLRSADGRPLWAIDASSTAPGVAVRVVVLSDAAPVRGSRGAIVRCVYVRTDSGVTVFVAADEMHDRPAGPATPVDLRSGR